MQRDLLCLVTFTQHKVFTVHPNCSMHQYILPVCGWIIFHPMNPHHVWFSIPSAMDIRLISTFWLLWVMLPSTFMCIFLRPRVFISLGWMPSRGTAGSYGKSKLNFLWIVFWLLDCMREVGTGEGIQISERDTERLLGETGGIRELRLPEGSGVEWSEGLACHAKC